MGLTGTLIVQTEIKSSADKFYSICKEKPYHVPNVSKTVPKVDLHEGSWDEHGCIKEWTYVADGKVETFKERMCLDDKNKTMKMVTLEGDPLKSYKTYVLTMAVTPKGAGSVVKWTLEYEKLKDDTPEPLHYLGAVINITRELEAHLIKST